MILVPNYSSGFMMTQALTNKKGMAMHQNDRPPKFDGLNSLNTSCRKLIAHLGMGQFLFRLPDHPADSGHVQLFIVLEVPNTKNC